MAACIWPTTKQTRIFTWAGILAVLVIAFALLGHWTSSRLSPKTFSRVVYRFMALAGAANVVRYFI